MTDQPHDTHERRYVLPGQLPWQWQVQPPNDPPLSHFVPSRFGSTYFAPPPLIPQTRLEPTHVTIAEYPDGLEEQMELLCFNDPERGVPSSHPPSGLDICLSSRPSSGPQSWQSQHQSELMSSQHRWPGVSQPGCSVNMPYSTGTHRFQEISATEVSMRSGAQIGRSTSAQSMQYTNAAVNPCYGGYDEDVDTVMAGD